MLGECFDSGSQHFGHSGQSPHTTTGREPVRLIEVAANTDANEKLVKQPGGGPRRAARRGQLIDECGRLGNVGGQELFDPAQMKGGFRCGAALPQVLGQCDKPVRGIVAQTCQCPFGPSSHPGRVTLIAGRTQSEAVMDRHASATITDPWCWKFPRPSPPDTHATDSCIWDQNSP